MRMPGPQGRLLSGLIALSLLGCPAVSFGAGLAAGADRAGAATAQVENTRAENTTFGEWLVESVFGWLGNIGGPASDPLAADGPAPAGADQADAADAAGADQADAESAAGAAISGGAQSDGAPVSADPEQPDPAQPDPAEATSAQLDPAQPDSAQADFATGPSDENAAGSASAEPDAPGSDAPTPGARSPEGTSPAARAPEASPAGPLEFLGNLLFGENGIVGGSDLSELDPGAVVGDAARRYEGMRCFDALADAVEHGYSTVDGMGPLDFSVDEVKAALEGIALDPEFYYLDPSAVTIWSSSLTGEVTKVELAYVVEPFELAVYRKRVEDRIVEALTWVSADMTTVEAAQALHDYLVRTVVYSTEVRDNGSGSPEPYNAYGALVSRSCVCDGYSDAYVLLLRRIGIEARMVVSEEMSHSWTMVCIGDQWYHVDVTWDDPTPDGGFRRDASHVYFLRGDEQMGTVGDQLHYGWKTQEQTLFDRWGELAVTSGAVAPDAAQTPTCPDDYSKQHGDIDQDGEYPADVDAAYPRVYDGPAAGPALPEGTADGWFFEPAEPAGLGRVYWIEGGAAARGFRDIDGARYYFNETSGAMARSKFLLLDGSVYRFGEDGRMMFGEHVVDWWWYWSDPTTGAIAADTFIWPPDGRTLYFDARGHRVHGEFQTPDGAWRCFSNGDGDMARDAFLRFESDGRVCYFDDDGVRAQGTVMIDGLEFTFDSETGALDEAGVALLSWG